MHETILFCKHTEICTRGYVNNSRNLPTSRTQRTQGRNIPVQGNPSLRQQEAGGMETRIHSTCGHARASTARPRGMEINIKSNSGKDLRGVQFPSPRTGQDHHRCPRRRPPKKLPKGTWSRNALLGVSPVCRGCAERCLNSAPGFLSSLSHPSLLSAHAGIYIFPLTPDQPPL